MPPLESKSRWYSPLLMLSSNVIPISICAVSPSAKNLGMYASIDTGSLTSVMFCSLPTASLFHATAISFIVP